MICPYCQEKYKYQNHVNKCKMINVLQKSMVEIQNYHAIEIEQLKIENQLQAKKMEEQFTLKLNEYKEKFEKDIEYIKTQYNETVSRLAADHDRYIEQLKQLSTEKESEIVQLQEKCKKLEKVYHTCKNEIIDKNNEIDEIQTMFKNDIQNKNNDFTRILRECKNTIEDLQTCNNSLKNSILEYKKQIKDLENNHTSVQNTSTRKLETSNLKILYTKEYYESKLIEINNQIKKIECEHGVHITEKNEKIKLLEMEKRDLETICKTHKLRALKFEKMVDVLNKEIIQLQNSRQYKKSKRRG